MSDLAPILQGFFTDRMITQKHASEHTIRSYRDTWRLLLAFAQDATGTQPWKLDIGQLDAAPDHRFPALAGNQPRLQPGHPQRPPVRDPFAVPLRIAAGTGQRGRHPARPGHRGQPDGHDDRQLAHR